MQAHNNLLFCQTEDDILETPEKISKVHSENCCRMYNCFIPTTHFNRELKYYYISDVCRDTLETILRRQEEIIGYLKNGPTNLCKDLRFDLLPAMPFNDLNDFLDFDESLSNENVLEQLVSNVFHSLCPQITELKVHSQQ